MTVLNLLKRQKVLHIDRKHLEKEKLLTTSNFFSHNMFKRCTFDTLKCRFVWERVKVSDSMVFYATFNSVLVLSQQLTYCYPGSHQSSCESSEVFYPGTLP